MASTRDGAVSRRQLIGWWREGGHAARPAGQGGEAVLADADSRSHSLIEVSADCIALKGVSCRLCEEACDVSAIRFRPKLGGGEQILLEEQCNGCGACLPVCPVSALSLTTAEVAA